MRSATVLGATCAFGLGLAAQAAFAQEWTASVGGEAIIGFGYVDAELHEAGAEVVMDSEVIFNFRLEADNGLTFGAKAELENNGASENMDEYVGFVSGGFGRVEVGSEDGAGDSLLLSPPGCNLSCSGDGDGFLFDYAEDQAGAAIDNDGGDSSDDLKITYYTPGFSGFQAGVSWGPTGEEGGTSTDGFEDSGFIEAGARWDIDLTELMGDEGAELALAGSYFLIDDYEEDSFALAAELDAYGVGVGGRFAYLDDDDEMNFSVGLEYGSGPWTGGVNYTQVIDSDGRDEDFGVSAEINYALAPGVTLAGIVEFAEYGATFEDDDETDFDESEADGGFAIGLLTELDF